MISNICLDFKLTGGRKLLIFCCSRHTDKQTDGQSVFYIISNTYVTISKKNLVFNFVTLEYNLRFLCNMSTYIIYDLKLNTNLVKNTHRTVVRYGHHARHGPRRGGYA